MNKFTARTETTTAIHRAKNSAMGYSRRSNSKNLAVVHKSGFTLMELLTVVTLVGVMAAFAAPSMSRMIAAQRGKSVSTNLYLSLTKARSEAIKRNAPVIILPYPNWQGWRIYIDKNGNGDIDVTSNPATNELLSEEAAVESVSVLGAPPRVTYLGSGRIRGGLPLTFSVTVPGKWDMTNGEGRCLVTDPSGRPSVTRPACS